MKTTIAAALLLTSLTLPALSQDGPTCSFSRNDAITEILAGHYVPQSMTGALLAAFVAAVGDVPASLDELLVVKAETQDPSSPDGSVYEAILVGIQGGCVQGTGQMPYADFQAILDRITP
jgi:hypothetical protein